MNVIDQALTNINVQNNPNVLWRYVDDIFVAFNDQSALNIFFNGLSNVYCSITFINELECRDSLVYYKQQRIGCKLTLAFTRIGQVSFLITKMKYCIWIT